MCRRDHTGTQWRLTPDSKSRESEPPVGPWKGGGGASRSWSRHCGCPWSCRSRRSGGRRLCFRSSLVEHLVELGVVLGRARLLLLPLGCVQSVLTCGPRPLYEFAGCAHLAT